jgi:hypothetical protein
LEIEPLVEYFSFYGGMQNSIELNLFEDIQSSLERNFVTNFATTKSMISPSYLIEPPYRELLVAVARGDGRVSNIYKRSRMVESVGSSLIADLEEAGVLSMEESRQPPLKKYPKQLLKKSLRGFRIQPKARFVKPFYRFWFGFVEPFREDLSRQRSDRFIDNFKQHKDKAISLVFEHLSNQLLELYFAKSDPLVSHGSFWDHRSEFDLLSITRSGQSILGECKYTSRNISKKELTKLKDKAQQSGLKVDIYALFSKSGFSNELLAQDIDSLLLFDLDSFQALL